MAFPQPPVTQQIQRDPLKQTGLPASRLPHGVELAEVARCKLRDRAGTRLYFGDLFQKQKTLLVFVRHFLCYTAKEYVEDLAKVPKSFLLDADIKLVVIGQSSYQHIEPFCRLTGYSHEIYVDPERDIYKKLGMKRAQSPHVKSNVLSGGFKSFWRAMTGPVFDFQGDPAQQGGSLILGPGNNLHFMHLDRNRLDHMPINSLLEQAGVQIVDFAHTPQIIDV
ncbi:peroxiredoxin-like 2C isoform X2 [Ambystoma mexicanum]|uniref:peroxiredoxin-like 2C isoform X2 n=1 Tax=Ambystoma mexicanum TaxID=8296 RepID=UPI0037E8ACF7